MSGVMLAPQDGRLWLPNGQIWNPPESAEGIPLDRIVPRICYVPDTYAFSAGQECIDLAEAAGLVLDPWQQLVVNLGLAETKLGKWTSFIVTLIVSRQNGKGSILEALELYWMFVGGERLVGHSAHEYKTAMEGFRRVLFLIENNDWLRKRVKKVINTNGEEGIELLKGNRLRFMARSKGAGRGFTFNKIVWDEGYALTREQQDAQLPTMSAVDNPQIWITSSPPLTSDTGEVLFQVRRLALSMGVKLTFLDYGIPGALDNLENINLDDRNLWRQSNPSEVHAGSGHGISIEAMESERAAMSDPGFARERLGVWPPDLNEGYGVISQEDWDALLDPQSGSDERPLSGLPVISIDVSPRTVGSVRASIGLASKRIDGKRHLEVIARDSGTAWVIRFLRKFLAVTPVGGIAIDPGSPAGSLLADLENLLTELGHSPDLIMRMATRDVASAFGMIYDAATDGEISIVHIGQPELTLAIGGATTRNVGDGRAWDRKAATTDITGLISVTNALWALANAAEPQETEILVMYL